jgi:hypothetical protein
LFVLGHNREFAKITIKDRNGNCVFLAYFYISP